ncbi:MAG: GNAT family N-acetyltransferase [bacterium]|nr:GNAT family N-acetyltransferase [bacterium]
MNIVSFNDIGSEKWDTFCAREPEAWVRHTASYLKFVRTLGAHPIDHSFGVTIHDELVAVVPLVSYESQNGRTLDMDDAVPFPAFAAHLLDSDRGAVINRVFKHIDDISAKAGVGRLIMFVDPLARPYVQNPMIGLQFTHTSMATSIVNLTEDENILLAHIQQRKRRYIQATHGRAYEFFFYDAHTITPDVCQAFERLYREDAGRVIGTPARWRETWELVRAGLHELMLVRASDDANYCGGHVLLTYKQRAYDHLLVRAPRYHGDNRLGPIMHWAMVTHFKGLGYERLEIGRLLFGDGSYSQKELEIAHFKAVLGGTPVPVWWGEKQYVKTDSMCI